MPTILLLIDGLRHDYINKEDSPFLYSLQQRNIHGGVRETFAFQLRPAFFAGLYPESCDISYLFMHDPEESPFKIINEITSPENVEEDDAVNQEFRQRIAEEVKRIERARGNSASAQYASPNEIPLKMLKFFSFSEKKNTFDPNSLPGESLFDILRSHNLKWLWIAYPTDDQRTASILEQLTYTDLTGIDFIFLHFAELDWAGHSYGPGSIEQKRILTEIDSVVEKIFSLMTARFENFNGIIFGDHGMVKIRNTVNIESELLKSGLKVPEDYVYFLDSTQARFWFKKDSVKQKIIDLLKEFEDFGTILNDEDYSRLHIRYRHNKFGDLYFVLHEGSIIYPNFFQRSAIPLGMHGYLPEVEENIAGFIVFGTGQQEYIKKPVEMVDIFPTTLNLLNLPVPRSCEGKGIFSNIERLKYFSVIIPTYNRKDLLIRTLETFSKQTYPATKFEVIVVDDGSDDETEECVKTIANSVRYPLKYFKQSNKGPAAARNKGVDLSTGEIILFTGDDCFPEPRLLEEHNRYYQQFHEDTNRGILGFTGIHPDIENTPFIKYLYTSGHQFAYPSLIDGKEVSFEYFYTTNLSLPKVKITELGGFDEEFRYAAFEDIEFGYRLSRSGFKLIYNQNAQTFHKHDTDLSKFIKRSIIVGEASVIFYKKHPELKDWWLGINAIINSSLRINFFDSVIKYAELLGMEKALREKITRKDPEILKICDIIKENRIESQNYLEQLCAENEAKISGQKKFIENLEIENNDYRLKVDSFQMNTQKLETNIQKLETNIQKLESENNNYRLKVDNLERQLAQFQFEIQGSIVWKLTTAFHKKFVERFLPQYTRRREYYDLGIKGGRLLLSKGIKYTISEFKSYRKTKKYQSMHGKTTITDQPRHDNLLNEISNIPFKSNEKNTGYVKISEDHLTLTKDDIKCIAFYLPQFHPIPENDLWWGKGFTEWTNVTKAQPQFKGHYQPHLPDELGFYDLRLPEIQKRQIELAQQYGIYGFCFHYYWFNGKRLLERPLNQFIENKDYHFPFCICWANENWTRRWDGMDNEILIAQNHSPESDILFIRDLIPLLNDPRYIKIKGKPLVIVYRANLLPEPMMTTNRWREYCRNAGIGEIFLCTTLYFGCDDPRKFGFDAAIEFPPHTMTGCKDITHKMTILNPDFSGKVFDYADFVQSKKYLQETTFPLFKTVSPGWDNTARRSNNAHIFFNTNPQLFQEWLYYVAKWTLNVHSPEERIVFINAWNEWAEGAYLEPDKKFGYGYLQATADAIMQIREQRESQKKKIIIVSHDAHLHGAQMLALHIAKALQEQFHYEIHLLLKSGGVLEEEFRKYAFVYNLEREYPNHESINNLIQTLYSKGISIAICNTVVSGDIVELLVKNKIRTISLIHELPGVIRQFGQLENAEIIARFADQVIFPSEMVKEKFSEIATIDEMKCVVRPQGLFLKNKCKEDTTAARKKLREILLLPANSKIILNVGFADSRKGIDIFVKVARKILTGHHDVWFVWVGLRDESLMASIDAEIERSGLTDRILFPGIRRDDLDIFYSGADIFLLSSREDPFPSVILDAMDARLPIVGFDNAGGFKDIVTETTGILVPFLSVNHMVDAVSQILENPNLRIKLGNNAATLIERNFNFSDYIYSLLGYLGHDYKKISVILPSYNYERYLPERLKSILTQTYPIYEIIAIDDNSTDNSVQILKQFAEHAPVPLKVFENSDNSGSVFKQWAKGIALAGGDYIWIAEADDLSEKFFLEEIVKGFHDDTVVLSYSQSRQIDANGETIAPDYCNYTNDINQDKWKNDYLRPGIDEICDSLAIKNTIPNVSAVVFAKRDLSGILGDLVSYKVAGDWFFYIWLLKTGSISYHARSLNLHRRHEKSVTISEKAQEHFNEIVKVQDYVKNNFPVDHLTQEKVLRYRDYVRKYLMDKTRLESSEFKYPNGINH